MGYKSGELYDSYDCKGNFKGKCFSIKGFTTNVNYSQISKEEYDRLSSMKYEEVEKEIKDKLPDYIFNYGYYGHDIVERDGMYFLGKEIGNSCD